VSSCLTAHQHKVGYLVSMWWWPACTSDCWFCADSAGR